jgi:cyclophilin family peptidyl-prolyl cis-trans isomerase
MRRPDIPMPRTHRLTTTTVLVTTLATTVWLKPDTTNGDTVSAFSRTSISAVVSAFRRTVASEVVSTFRGTVYAQSPPKQAVVETSAGTFIMDLAAETAPNQVAFFIKTAQEGAYDGTTFHRVVKYGMVQGGDPLSKDPAKRSLYGTGGLNAVKAEARAAKLTRGSVAAVLVPGKPDSAGAQFFIVLADQPALDGQYTVFGRVSDGMEVLQKISETPVDASGVVTERVGITRVTIRDTPPEPFITESAQQLGAYHGVLDTSAGPITIEFFADKAPDTVRQFLRLAAAGVYNGMAFHRVAPGFVIQTGALSSRQAPLTEKQQKLVRNLSPEFNDTKHVKGIVSMARGDDPGSASTSFFICTGTSSALDGVYTAFGRVVDGMTAVEAIEAAARTGETPNTRIELQTVHIVKR